MKKLLNALGIRYSRYNQSLHIGPLAIWWGLRQKHGTKGRFCARFDYGLLRDLHFGDWS